MHLEAPAEGGGVRRFVFSGDVGRYDMPLHPDPKPRPDCDVLVVESTYGNRDHKPMRFESQIQEPFTNTFKKGGTVLIPSFAVGRAQQVTLILREMMKSKQLPEVPIHIDSPMAVDATRIYSRFLDETNLDATVSEDGRSRLFPRRVFFSRSVEESKALNYLDGPRIIISSSGMMTNGRILHHMRRLLPNPDNLLCVVGYQAAGTRGRAMLDGADRVRIHGRDVEVRAELLTLNGLSGHADRGELTRWIESADTLPETIFVVHGEEDVAEEFRRRLHKTLHVRTEAPALGESFDV